MRLIFGNGRLDFKANPKAVPRFTHDESLSWARGKDAVPRSTKAIFRCAAGNMKRSHQLPAGHGDIAFLQNPGGTFETHHSSIIATDPASPMASFMTKLRDLSDSVNTEVLRLDGNCKVRATRNIPAGEPVLMDGGDVYTPIQHAKLVSRAERGRRYSSVEIPIVIFHPYLTTSYLKANHDKCLVVESGKRGTHARFLRKSNTPNLKPAVFVNALSGLPTLFYTATRNIAKGETLTISENGNGFLPIPAWVPPPNATAGRSRGGGGRRRNPDRRCRSQSAPRRSLDRAVKKPKTFHYGK